MAAHRGFADHQGRHGDPLKATMGADRMRAREHELMAILLRRIKTIPSAVACRTHRRETRTCRSISRTHFNLIVRLFNDRYGIQVRGGCSCAGTYGHYLLHVDPMRSKSITDRIDAGDMTDKPGWVRLSIHPTTSDAEAHAAVDALREIAANAAEWAGDYDYDPHANEFRFRGGAPDIDVRPWFDIS
jgi:selenocysteine lyase/cysteine desulfurase